MDNKRHRKIKDNLIEILNGTDEVWKRGVLVSLIMKSRKKIDPKLLTLIERIANYPTEAEKDDLVDIAARDVIMNHKL